MEVYRQFPGRMLIIYGCLLGLCILLFPELGIAQDARSDDINILEFTDHRYTHFVIWSSSKRDSVSFEQAKKIDESLRKNAADIVEIKNRLSADTVPDSITLIHLQVSAGESVKLDVKKDLNRFLIKKHKEYKYLKQWFNSWKKRMVATADSQMTLANRGESELRRLDQQLHELMEIRGLKKDFSASLVSGGLLSTSENSHDFDSNSDSKKSPLARIIWESKHFGAASDAFFDFSFGGSFGFQPALTLIKSVKDGAIDTSTGIAMPDTNMLSNYQEAFIWDINGRLNMHFSSQAEASLFGRAGQVTLNSKSVLVDQGGTESRIGIPLNNNAARNAWFFEAGFSYKRYNKPLEQLHPESGLLDPVFDLILGFRHDKRFKKDGDLVQFDGPENRFFFKFMINALQVFDNREIGDKSRVFTIGFGVEYERTWFGSNKSIPSGTQFLIKGDLDILQALRGGPG